MDSAYNGDVKGLSEASALIEKNSPRGKRAYHYLGILFVIFTLMLTGCSQPVAVSSQAEVSAFAAAPPGTETGESEQSLKEPGMTPDPETSAENGTSPAASETETGGLAQEPVPEAAPIAMTPPQPDPPQTPIRPFYELAGSPPTAPGLAMRSRIFSVEPAKIVYLTFDDGPSPNTPQILKILKDEAVHATFFVIGTQVEQYPDYLKQEYQEANAIGNHTYSHKYSEIYKSPQAFLENIKKNEDLLDKMIGIRPSIIRTPGGTQGHFHVSYYNAIDAAGYLVYDWNVSSGDAEAPLVPADRLVRNVKNQVPGKDRVILLMHDAAGKTTTVEALPRIIEYLKNEGFTFGILTPEVAPILFPGGFHS